MPARPDERAEGDQKPDPSDEATDPHQEGGRQCCLPVDVVQRPVGRVVVHVTLQLSGTKWPRSTRRLPASEGVGITLPV